MAKSPYTSRKLLNELKRLEKESEDMMLTHNLHDIAINGKNVGCSGHITNIFNKRCVYVNTEKSVYQPISDKDLVRYAENEMDYSSIGLGVNGRNIFVTDDVLATKIIDMLR